MKIGLLVAKIDKTYRARISIGKVPETLPCEEEIFTLLEDDGRSKADDTNLSKTRGLITIIKQKGKEEARRRGIELVENLDSDLD